MHAYHQSLCEIRQSINQSNMHRLGEDDSVKMPGSLIQSINQSKPLNSTRLNVPGISNEFIAFKDHCNTNTGVVVTQITVCNDMIYSFHPYVARVSMMMLTHSSYSSIHSIHPSTLTHIIHTYITTVHSHHITHTHPFIIITDAY